MAPKAITRPRVYIKNDEYISCQIIRDEAELAIFNKKDKFRRCLINDYDNFQYWKRCEAPYNDDNMTFGIRKSHYEAFTGEIFPDYPGFGKKYEGLITSQRWTGMKGGEV